MSGEPNAAAEAGWNEGTPDAPKNPPERGIALCLSGGGYRAMLFHVGALWRLNELRLLPQLKRVSSVSGGSITAGVLAANWGELGFEEDFSRQFDSHVVQPVRKLARQTIDAESILGGLFSPRRSISDNVVEAYRQVLFQDKTLQDLPDDSGPRFVINATNVQTGALWRFSRPYMGDYRVGLVHHPRVSLAEAVCASSAFPPYLSPVRLRLRHDNFAPDPNADLQKVPYTTEVVLSDGGVYDNLGLETVFKRYQTLLVSDGGGQMAAQADPASDWVRHSCRIMEVVDNQVRSLRKRMLMDAYQDRSGNPLTFRTGAFWGIRTNIANYKLDDALNEGFPHHRTLELAETPTRLKAMPEDLQERLVNWGYAVCDAAVRRHYLSESQSCQLPPPKRPYDRDL